MLDCLFTMLYDWRAANCGAHPRTLHIGYLYDRQLRLESRDYHGMLPIVTPLTVFGMAIVIQYSAGPWAWIEGV